MENLNAQHCLTIAAAFIAIVAACASLISFANGKSDSLATRYREVTKEYREEAAKEDAEGAKEYRAKRKISRRAQLQQQIELYVKRVRKVLWAQRLLFFTISIFILSIAMFIGLALRIVYATIPGEPEYKVSQQPIEVIGACVMIGAFCMFAAIILLFLELREAAETFKIETSDCLPSKARSVKEELQVA
jgi:ABC-type multidrug transport system fused ATPase/permease subunit